MMALDQYPHDFFEWVEDSSEVKNLDLVTNWNVENDFAILDDGGAQSLLMGLLLGMMEVCCF